MQTVKCAVALADQACLAVLDLGDVAVEFRDAAAHKAAVDLELLLARPVLMPAGRYRRCAPGDPTCASAAGRCTASGQLNWSLASCVRGSGEDVEDQLAAVEHLDALEARLSSSSLISFSRIRRSARGREVVVRR